LPSGLTFVSASDGGRHIPGAGTVEWLIGDLQPNRDRTVRLKVRADKMGTHTNQVTATADRGLMATAQAETKVEGKIALHIDSFDTYDPVVVGQQTTYVVTIKNEGTMTAHNVVLVNTIPAEMKLVNVTGPTSRTEVVVASKIEFEKIPVLAPDEEATFKITVEAVKEGEAVNTAEFNCDEFRRPVMSQEGTRVYAK